MMRHAGLISAAFAGLFAAQATAQGLELPAPATMTFQSSDANAEYALPVGPFYEGQVQTMALKGAVSLETWRLGGNRQATHLLAAGLLEQLGADGYEVLYQCAEDQCGGFDFRFAITVANEPHMHVDLGDYRFISARKPGQAGNGDSYATLLVSRSPGAGFVQITRITPPEDDAQTVKTVTSSMTTPDGNAGPAMPAGAAIGAQLDQNGYAVLSDLVFETGSSDLGAGPFDSLSQLAAYLAMHPDRRVALVGHTDAEGSLEANIALSRRRAASVRHRLIDDHALPGAQMTAQGVGFLAPLTSNMTEAGRTQNRRVEVVLTSTR